MYTAPGQGQNIPWGQCVCFFFLFFFQIYKYFVHLPISGKIFPSVTFKQFFGIYSHDGHLGHVTMTIYTNFHFPFPTMLHIKIGFD